MGTIIWYAASTPPAGWLICNGQSTSSYPALAAIVGAYVPDLRGEFIRGVDLGRGIDTGRTFKSSQGDAIRNIIGQINFERSFGGRANSFAGSYSGALSYSTVSTSSYGFEWGSNAGLCGSILYFNAASSGIPTADENRPRNVALLPCIKY